MPPVSPATSPIAEYLDYLHRTYAELRDGKVATYIPELAKANPDWFGITLVTAGGAIYEAGDTRQPFTIQSISKPFVYGLALEDHGRTEVLKKIGMEPTGDAFNSISLEPGTGRPRNPMINAGAIAAASLIVGKNPEARLRRVLDTLSLYAGRPLALDDAVFRSEHETGHRNRAIGHMLRNFEILTTDPVPSVDLYFQQCSVSVTCRDLGVMAATLANRGVNPITGHTAIRGAYVENILSVMGSCGMYDYAGEWIYRIGMPAKSGVSGGIVAVLPGQLGIGVFSPPLDCRGNSVRGIRVCDDFSQHFDLHLFNRPSSASSVIRLKFTAAEFGSCRCRTAVEMQILRETGTAIRVYQLQGHLTFPTTEALLRDLLANQDGADSFILDCRRILSLAESAARLLHETLLRFAAIGIPIVFTYTESVPFLRRYLKLKLGQRFEEIFHSAPDNDRGLEWCENRFLASQSTGVGDPTGHPEPTYDLLSGLDPEQRETLQALLVRRTWREGEMVIQRGSTAAEIFLLARGRVSVLVSLPNGTPRRIASFQAGMNFGEMAVLDGAPRSADIVADTEVECDCLRIEDLNRLEATRPDIKIRLLEHLSRDLSYKLRKSNRELAVFA